MAKVKPQRTSPSLDMTPLVDLAFLLVTFFMLTTKFAPDDPVIVDMPSSVSEIKLPETDIMTITVSREGQVYFGIDGQFTKQRLLDNISQKYGVSFSPEETRAFVLSSSFGLPIRGLKSYLALEPAERKKIQQPGIPTDSTNNELADWIVYSRMANPKLRIAIKGDRDADYPTVAKVISTLQDKKVNRFNLITNMEAGPKD
ncbi:MAG: biopolymer transporter ExbD [Chitinophagaceae bacterium]|nr:MAG: biopolymer transporter ExbD [Chitinophagaceae bacterium]